MRMRSLRALCYSSFVVVAFFFASEAFAAAEEKLISAASSALASSPDDWTVATPASKGLSASSLEVRFVPIFFFSAFPFCRFVSFCFDREGELLRDCRKRIPNGAAAP